MAEIRTYPNWLRGLENYNNNWVTSWDTTIKETASGRIRTVSHQKYPKQQTYLYYPHLTDAQADNLEAFVNQLQGSNKFCWYKDFSRYRVVDQQLPRTDDNKFQFMANISGYLQPVGKVDNLTVKVNGVSTTNYTVEGGVITIPNVTSTTTVVASYDYYFKMRISEDGITIRRNNAPNTNNVSLTLVVVRD